MLHLTHCVYKGSWPNTFWIPNIIARLIFALLPHIPPYRHALDRINWKFGDKRSNIFTLIIVYQCVTFPVLFSMLDKQGNSATTERIALMERYV